MDSCTQIQAHIFTHSLGQRQTQIWFTHFQFTNSSIVSLSRSTFSLHQLKVFDLELKLHLYITRSIYIQPNRCWDSLVMDSRRFLCHPLQLLRSASIVVGWPPIRSFRKNRASGCASKLPVETEARSEVSTKIDSKKQTQSSQIKGFFVKINMDGVPIGRKVNLNAYDSYEKSSSAANELFRGLLAAQTDPSAYSQEEVGEKAITGLLDRSGEYTLVYEDNEGDRMLVGDVPWNMFVSTVKRLRVLKSSKLSSLLRMAVVEAGVKYCILDTPGQGQAACGDNVGDDMNISSFHIPVDYSGGARINGLTLL